MESLAEIAKKHLEAYQANLQSRSFLIKSPPQLTNSKWIGANQVMKVPYGALTTYVEQLEEYVAYLKEAIGDRKTQVGEVEKSIDCVDMAITEFKKRKEPEATVPTIVSVVETPVLKKQAPTVLRK